MLRLPQSSLESIENKSMGVESIWNDSDESLIDRNDETLLELVIPTRIDDGCYGRICFYWAPDGKTLSYGINATIPLVIAHIWGVSEDPSFSTPSEEKDMETPDELSVAMNISMSPESLMSVFRSG